MYNEEKIISKWIADMYDYNETDITDVEFALSVIGTNPKRILEIACGSGRILVPLGKAGHLVTGLDFDEYMLSKISKKSKGM
ncbi:MAG TPA: class I SAM-dependent methyltransferase, partial [Candidatus Gallacutalibacter pullicola]|nr:class I SAM-dependent methyltransferase [Candidatus Gallacutalibacter pullicola]